MTGISVFTFNDQLGKYEIEIEFSTHLEVIRKQRGISQTELSVRCGLQPSAIAHFEAGRRKPSFDNIILLSQGLQVTTDYLLGLSKNSGSIFKNEEKLSLSDRDFIQTMINEIVKKKLW